ncbi:MAG: AAA family ATPase [Mizugakiibacter sp.]|uniref:AAA family ATPase n=1 Tax=Mizugakiibacter sp. TaxID=1972610 RepID=UPI0031C67AB0|nr:ATP-binding protein [Xanthomonadaceae bacterium]
MPAPSVPVLIAPLGLPGAGKSALARALARRLGLPRVCRDAIRAAMFPEGTAAAAEKRAAFAAALAAADAHLRARRGCVLDGATFARGADRRRVAALARRHGARLVWLWLDCPPALARGRVARQRAHPAPDRTPALVDAVAARFAPPPADAIRLDAGLPRNRLLAQALAAVSRAQGGSRPAAAVAACEMPAGVRGHPVAGREPPYAPRARGLRRT